MIKTILLLAAVALVQARPDEGLERSNACPADVFGTVPHESDCSKFYMCVQGVKVELACASGTLYNAELQVCDWASNVQCSSNVASLSGSSDNKLVLSEQVSSDICPPNFFGNVAHESDCNKFYVCVQGTKIELSCASGFYFNAELKVCDWAENVQCSSSDVASSNDKLVLSEQVSSDICPPNFFGNVAHESDCNKFYVCVQGTKIELSCASGFYFNAELKVCDWAENVQCSSSDVASSNDKLVISEQVSSDICPPNYFGNVAHESDCNKFYVCVQGTQIELSCASGFYFNADLKVCDWAENVQCSSSDVASSNDKLVLSEQVSSDICPPNFFGNVAHESDCNKFYVCVQGTKIELSCASGFYFNAELKVCDWAENVQCSSSDVASSNDKLVLSEQVSSDICPPNFFGNVAHESDCNKFYVCVQGTKIELSCASGFYFNAELKVCDWAENVQCSSSDVASSNDKLVLSEQVSSDICPPNFFGNVAHESDCNKFYVCVQGTKIELSCASGFYFNAELKVCDWAENVQCSSSDIASSNDKLVLSEQVSSDICPPNYFGNVAHESDCNKFYLCVQGTKIELSCASGFYFNAELKVCDWAENVQCSSSDVATSNDKLILSEQVSSNVCPPNYFGNLPHDSDCSKFYLCIQEVKIELTCASGLHYNAELQVCDWAENVNCLSSDITSRSDKQPRISEPVSPNSCPADFFGAVPHESNCGLFYMCLNGVKVQLACAADLHFNAELKVCDWPQSAGCAV